MPQNFYALCRQQDELLVKRIRLNAAVRTQLVQLFNAQAEAYVEGIDTEEEYTGDWEREPNEIYTIEDHPEVDTVLQVASGNAQAIPNLDVNNFEDENIKAVFTSIDTDGSQTLLIQSFSGRQMLDSKPVLIYQGNHFNVLSDPAFIVDDKLGCIVEDGTLKFKKYAVARSIFDLTEYYLEATDEDIEEFFNNASAFSVENLEVFKTNVADQVIRKLIHSISTKRDLGQYTNEEIVTAAGSVELTLEYDEDGKIALPQDRKEAKKILRFLDDKLYEAPLSRERYIANSTKPVD